MLQELFLLVGGFFGIVIVWNLVGYAIGALTLFLKASFKPRGERWAFIKEVIVIAPDVWFDGFRQLGPVSVLIIPVVLLAQFHPQNERDSMDLNAFRHQTGLSTDQWVNHGHRSACEFRSLQSLREFDAGLERVQERIGEIPRKATYWARVSAYWTKRYAWATATCAMLLASVRSTVAYASDTSSSQTEESGQPTVSVEGYGIVSLQSTVKGEEVRLNYLRLKPVYEDGDWSLRGEVDLGATMKLKTAYVGYDSPELRMRVEAGRIIAPYASNFIPANRDEFNRTPLDDRLGVPLFDNGIVVSRDVRLFGRTVGTKLAVTNGNGDFEDNNSAMDVSGRISTKTRFGTFSLTGQVGDQPQGERQVYLACYELTVGPISFRSIGMERPDIDGRGFMTSLVTRAGPWSFSAQYDQASLSNATSRFWDFGVNVMCAPKTRLKFRTLVSDQCGPEFSIRVVKLF